MESREPPLDAIADIPDPAAAVAARVAPSPPAPPDAASPTRIERRNRIRFAAALAVAWIVAVIVRFGVRDDLVAPGVLGLLVIWSALAAVGLALTLLPRGRGLPPGIRAVQIALAAIPAIWIATAIARTASAPEAPLTLRTAGACMTIANVMALGPLVVAGLLIRGSFTSAPALRGAAVGAAAGLLGAIGIHAHCPIEAASHVVVAHGAPLVAGALVGAVLGALRGRP